LVLFGCYCLNFILDLKNRLRKICGEYFGYASPLNVGGSGDIVAFKEIIQHYPQLVNEVRILLFRNFLFLCFFLVLNMNFRKLMMNMVVLVFIGHVFGEIFYLWSIL
jgi:hypothetical protein